MPRHKAFKLKGLGSLWACWHESCRRVGGRGPFPPAKYVGGHIFFGIKFLNIDLTNTIKRIIVIHMTYPTPLSPYVFKKILHEVEMGHSLEHICEKDNRLPSRRVIEGYIQKTPKRLKAYRTARLKAHIVKTAAEKNCKIRQKKLQIQRNRKAAANPKPTTRIGHERMDEIYKHLSNGKTLTQICKYEGFPSRDAVLKYIRLNDEAKVEYDRARQAQGHWHFDIMTELSDDITNENATARKIQLDIKKYLASCLAKEYDRNKAVIDQSQHIHLGQDSPEAIELKQLKASQQEQQNRLYLMANKELPTKKTQDPNTKDTNEQDYIDV